MAIVCRYLASIAGESRETISQFTADQFLPWLDDSLQLTQEQRDQQDRMEAIAARANAEAAQMVAEAARKANR